jgi:protein-disulfide isomerase
MPAPAPSAPAATAAPAADKAAQAQSPPSLLAAPAALTIDVPAAMKDRVIGNDNAPVTIVEYAALSCPHCAHFVSEILPEVKKRLLDTGKAKLIFRDFPLDNFGLKAAMMTRCIPADKYFSLVEVVFSNQERWTQSKDPLEALAQLGALAGMDADFFKACTQNTELETAILNGINDAQSKYQIRSTPTFIFNNGAEVLTGAQDADQFEAIVNKLTGGK